jgi:hypothetical protein
MNSSREERPEGECRPAAAYLEHCPILRGHRGAGDCAHLAPLEVAATASTTPPARQPNPPALSRAVVPCELADEPIDRVEKRFCHVGRERIPDRILRSICGAGAHGRASDVAKVPVAQNVRDPAQLAAPPLGTPFFGSGQHEVPCPGSSQGAIIDRRHLVACGTSGPFMVGLVHGWRTKLDITMIGTIGVYARSAPSSHRQGHQVGLALDRPLTPMVRLSGADRLRDDRAVRSHAGRVAS